MTTTLRAALVALLGVAAFTPAALASKVPASTPSKGEMKVHDDAALFSPESVVKAEAKFHEVTFKSTTHLTVRTVKSVPSDRKRDFEKAKDDSAKRHEFMRQWAKELAQAEGDRGVVVLVCDEARSIEVLADRQTDVNRQFGDADAKRVHDILADGFKEANAAKSDDEKRAVRGESLVRATDFVIGQLRNTSAPEATGVTHSDGDHKTGSGGMHWIWWVVIIIGVLLVVWIVIALIRAMTGSVYGGGYGGYGGGYGGGGGFFSSFLGGMFGAAAGMWMYNSFFGGHMTHDPGYTGGADGTAGDTGTADTGAGEFDNGAEAGGDWGDDGGTAADGGGDWGGDGGGGDWGGGGDFGGGDFGGGGDW